MTDLIRRADAIDATWKEPAYTDAINVLTEVRERIKALPSAEAVSRKDYHNLLTASNDIDRALREYQAKEEQLSAEVEPKIDHDRDWIIGCIEHDGFIHTDRFDKANQIIHDALSAEAVHGYTEWLEKNIVEAETFEWLCEDTTDEEWCEKNCKYSSIQAECLRHLYEVSKGGDRWEV